MRTHYTKFLKQFAVSVGSEVIFLDLLSHKIYESYTINKIHIVRYLGVFQDVKYSSGLRKTSSVKFFPSKDFIRTMEKRRGDFHGVEITSVNKVRISFIDFSKIKNNNHNDDTNTMYDITNLTDILEIFYGIEPQVFKLMENNFNFTSKLFVTKENKLGYPKILSNGSIVIGDGGMFQYLKNGHVEMISSQTSMSPEAAEFGDLLPPIKPIYDAIIVRNLDFAEAEQHNFNLEILDWNVYFAPFSTELWIAIILKCIIFSIFVFVIEWSHNYKLVNSPKQQKY